MLPLPVLPVLLAFSTLALVDARPLPPEPVLPVLVPGAFSALALVEARPLSLDVLPVLVPAALSALTLVDAAPPPGLLSPIVAPGASSALALVEAIGAVLPSPVVVATFAAGLAGGDRRAPCRPWSDWDCTSAVTPFSPPTLIVCDRGQRRRGLLGRGLRLQAGPARALDDLAALAA